MSHFAATVYGMLNLYDSRVVFVCLVLRNMCTHPGLGSVRIRME